MSDFFLNGCNDGATSLNLSVTVPEVKEDPSAQFTSATEYFGGTWKIARGLWSVSFSRVPLGWTGGDHVFPIRHTTFRCGLTDGSTLESSIGAKYVIAGWPCRNGSGFADGLSDWFHSVGEDVQQGTWFDGSVCHSAFLFDLGCPYCGSTEIQLRCLSVNHLAFANSYGFILRANLQLIG